VTGVPPPARKGGRAVPIIGIAGGVGSGKSAASRALAGLGCLIADSDAATRRALERDDVKAALAAWWGPSVLGADGGVDRSAVARIVFADADERHRLEALIHPLVHEDRRKVIERAEREGAAGVVVDAPLLFEVGLDAECDAVVFVEVSRATRLARVKATRGWSASELDRRERAQLSVGEKRARSDFVVSNEGTENALAVALEPILHEICAAHARRA
jgi:dephospho-CoA kinase